MKPLKRSAIAFGSFCLIFLFQNCGGVDFNSIGVTPLQAGVQDLDVSPNTPSIAIPDIIEDDYAEADQSDEDRDDCRDKRKEKDPIKNYTFQEVPYDSPELEEALSQNVACADLFNKMDASLYPFREDLHLSGIKNNIMVANVGNLKISGVARSIAAKNIEVAQISGIHGSLCLQANKIHHISGLQFGTRTDVALIGPVNGLGEIAHLSGINRSDLVLVNFHVKHISGVGRSLHIFGGRVEKISGTFGEIHLHNGAVVEDLQGVNGSTIRH